MQEAPIGSAGIAYVRRFIVGRDFIQPISTLVPPFVSYDDYMPMPRLDVINVRLPHENPQDLYTVFSEDGKVVEVRLQEGASDGRLGENVLDGKGGLLIPS